MTAPVGAERATATVEALAAGGAGIVRAGGRVSLVPGVAPGDRVEVELASGARAMPRLLRVVSPGPDRVEPACEIAGTCGGCDWMHLAVAAQEVAHASIVREVLAHAVTPHALPEVRVHAAPRPLGYRSRVRLHAEADRRGVRLGYHAARSRQIVEPAACVVLEDGLLDVARAVARALEGARGSGEIACAFGARGGVADVAWAGELPAAFWARLEDAVDGGALSGARVTLKGAGRPATFGDPSPAQRGADGLPLILPPGGFGQPSAEGAALLSSRVRELARAEGREVLELFAGSGTLTVELARDAARVATVEIDAAAVRCAQQNLAARGLDAKVRASVGDAEATPIPKRAEIVVLDPPRTGAPGAAGRIAAARPKRVVYVSCDPPTLARDTRVLAQAGFAVVALETIELFPQTSHVETVAVFERGAAARRAQEGAP